MAKKNPIYCCGPKVSFLTVAFVQLVNSRYWAALCIVKPNLFHFCILRSFVRTENGKWQDPFEFARSALRSQSAFSFVAAVILFQPATNHNIIVVNALAVLVFNLPSILLNLVFFPKRWSTQYQQGSRMCLARPSSTQNSNAANMTVKSNTGKSVRGGCELKKVQNLSQNTQGFNEDKEEILQF